MTRLNQRKEMKGITNFQNYSPKKKKHCYIPTREVKVSVNKIPQSADVGTEFKNRILSISDSQTQDFASKHNILRMYSGKDAPFSHTVPYRLL